MYLALDNLHGLMCHKTKKINQSIVYYVTMNSFLKNGNGTF